MAKKIDAHHHLWHYDRQEYGWINESMPVLQQDYLPQHLQRELNSAGIDGSVVVQARQTLAETSWLLECANKSPWIQGVVGWAPLASANFPADLEFLLTQPKLKGLRHVVQDEADDELILGREFNQGVSLLKNTGLVYDILIYERHLPVAIQFVDRHPDQIFVLDHIAKPKIREHQLEPWRQHILELARRQNVHCKISGMVTEADWKTWSKEDLQPYIDVVLQAFGPSRLMAGSDWPVCLLAASYGQWFQLLQEFTSKLSRNEKERILGLTAAKVYQLDDAAVT